jgi:integrase/recombinase XerD
MDKFKEYLKINGYTSKSIHSIGKDITSFLAWLKAEKSSLEMVRYAEVLHYIETQKNQGNKQRTVQIKVGNLKHYFSYLQGEGIIQDNFIQHLKIQGVQRKVLYTILSSEELEHIYKSYPITSPAQQRNKCMVGLMIYQGLRSAELSKLAPEELVLREGQIKVNGSRRSNARSLELKSFQVMDLMEYLYQVRPSLLQENNKESSFCFVSSGSGKGLNNTIQKLIEGLKEQYKNIENMEQIHASVLNGWLKQYNLRMVQYMAGHKYISSTESYLTNDIEGLQESINTYFPL